jgi:hypothetical protein
MSKKKTLLAAVLLGTAGYGVHQNWGLIRAALGLDELSPEMLRAIDLAKSDYDLDRYMSNHEFIARRVRQAKGKVHVDGWSAERKSDTLFLVRFGFAEDGERFDWRFLVDVGALRSRNVAGNAELEQLYGVPASPR